MGYEAYTERSLVQVYIHSRAVTHAALHNGHTARRCSHRSRQHVWNTWPHAPMRSVCPDAASEKWSSSPVSSARASGAASLMDSLQMLHVSKGSSRCQVPTKRMPVTVTVVVGMIVLATDVGGNCRDGAPVSVSVAAASRRTVGGGTECDR